MQELPKYLIVFLTLLVILFSTYFLVLHVFDGSTTTILQSYTLTKDNELVRNHLREYRGEADGHETRIVFAEWGANNQQGFLDIVEGYGDVEKEHLCKAVGFAITDSAQDEKFEAAFSSYTTPCLQTIRVWIVESRQWQERWKQRQAQ